MELFGAKFSLALGAWRLRFVLMLEDSEMPQPHPAEGAQNVRPHAATMRTVSFN